MQSRVSRGLPGVAGTLALAGALPGCGQVGMAPVAKADGAAMVERGRYLVDSMGCADCHTPHDQGKEIAGYELTGHPPGAPLPQWDPAMLEQGVMVTMSPTFTAFAGPFGVSTTPNLTPDVETGIGNLTAEGLIRSWREGAHWQTGQPIKPPMPWPYYKNLSDEDIRAIHAYLTSLPAKKPTPLPG